MKLDAAADMSPAPVPAIRIRQLRVELGDQTVLRGIDLDVRRGRRVALVAPNGAGKSTLLRVVAGLIRPVSGDVEVDGRSLRADPWHARRAVGMVGHQSMLHPDLTALENLRVYAELFGLDAPKLRAEAVLQEVGLAEHAAQRVSTLSRGMNQRLALARALLHEPSILLLDEAESGLDGRARELLVSALQSAGRTTLLATHDLAFVREVADEAVFLRRGRVAGSLELGAASVQEIQDRYAEALSGQPRSERAALAPVGV